MDTDQAEKMKKSTWKNGVKTKLKEKIQQMLTDDLKKSLEQELYKMTNGK